MVLRLQRRAATLISTCLGLGYSPKAPGTAGSLGALAAGVVLAHYRGWGRLEFALLSGAALLPGIWAAGVESAGAGEEDPSRIVVDEAIGQWVAMAGITAHNWKSWLAALVLFRLFDIFKPPPIRQAERLHGGVGIVADDVAAGLAAGLVLFAAGCFNLY
ncbi:MAG: phosphatidylglycerophosphatase A [Bryobacterales bacterium]|jgi:phosphatidylglycerophosphatase A|nr:phosphatidylglycerophosphatase A [Bryobacterales bacterium]